MMHPDTFTCPFSGEACGCDENGDGVCEFNYDRPFGPDLIARRFHELYEQLAPAHGWQTQERSAVPWEEVPLANKSLMVAVVSCLIAEGLINRGRRA